nr:hypothetical protein [Tanacetum cinerariifolium]
WSRFVMIVKQQQKLDEVSYHKLFDILKQYQNEVIELRAERLARNANPLALVATAQANQDPYYQTSRSHRSQASSSKPLILTRSHTTTRHKGKEIAKPITPPSEIASEKDTGSESRPHMLNKENYVPWSSRLLQYAKSRPNGKLIHNSILNGPYEIWLRVQQMMKGSDIEIQEKKAKLFNEWERFTSNKGESIESCYHRFLKLINDLKRNKHFPEKIASNLKLKDMVQNVRNPNGLMGVQRNGNHNQIGNGNLVAARAKGNVAGQNGNHIRCYNCRGIVPQNDNDVVSEVTGMEQGGEIVEQHPVNFKETRALYDSLYQNLATEVEKVNSILDLNKQLSKEKSTVSFLLEEKKKLKSDFKTCEDELLDKQIELEKKIKELNNIVLKMGQFIQTIHMLSPKQNSFYHTEQKMAFGYQNSFYLKQAQKKQQSLYDGKVLLAKHDPIVVRDFEETLQLAQESRQKMKQ